MSERYLEGKHAIVTGASRGIGASIARELARLSATLTLMARDQESLDEFAAQLRKEPGAKVAALACDVSEEKSVVEAFAAAQKGSGSAYILVNNAGQAEGAAFSETSPELWERMLAVNLTGAYLCTRQVLPQMLEAKA